MIITRDAVAYDQLCSLGYREGYPTPIEMGSLGLVLSVMQEEFAFCLFGEALGWVRLHNIEPIADAEP